MYPEDLTPIWDSEAEFCDSDELWAKIALKEYRELKCGKEPWGDDGFVCFDQCEIGNWSRYCTRKPGHKGPHVSTPALPVCVWSENYNIRQYGEDPHER